MSKLSRYLPSLILVIFFSGCFSTATEIRHESRQWKKLTYKEIVLINTEPSQSRIYVRDNYVGISPVEATLEFGDVHVTQDGWYKLQYLHNYTVRRGPDNRFNERRISGTEWSGELNPSIDTHSYIIKAYKGSGYEPVSKTITISTKDRIFRESFSNLIPDDDEKIPSTIVGHRSVLLILMPKLY